jgi:hypothetical protein
MLKESPKLLHWNYFLVLESNLEHLSRYIEFTEDNYKTYSQEMAHLLLTAGSEVDVVLKGLCRKNNSSFRGRTIDRYREILNPKYPNFCKLKVSLQRFGLDISPWANWQNDETPNWWHDYNLVKHNRDEHYNLANLKNTIASLAGLFLAVLYFYKNEAEKGKLIPDPKLLMIQEDFVELHRVLDRGRLRKYVRIYKLT